MLRMRMGAVQGSRLIAYLLAGAVVLAACGAGDADQSETLQPPSVEESVVDWLTDALRTQPGGHAAVPTVSAPSGWLPHQSRSSH